MVVISSHTTPWACGDLDGIAARRDICVSYRSTFENTGMGDGLVSNEESDLGGT